jgi:predicted metalloenzyme YecM
MLVFKASFVLTRERKNCDTFYARVQSLFHVDSWMQELWFFLCSCSKPLSCWLVNARIVILLMLVFKASIMLSRERKNCDTFYARVQRLFRVVLWTQELWYFLCSCSKPLLCWLVNARIVIFFMLVFKASFVLTRERKNCDTFYARVQSLFRVDSWTQELWYFLCLCSKPLSCCLVNARIVILFMLVFKASIMLSRERKNCDTFYARVQRLFRVVLWTQELWYFLCSCSKPLLCWLVNARIVIFFMLVFKASLSCWLVNARIVILFMLMFKASFVLTRERKNWDTFYARVQSLFRVDSWTQELWNFLCSFSKPLFRVDSSWTQKLWYFLCSCSQPFSSWLVNARIVILFMLVFRASFVLTRERKNCDTFYACVQSLFRVDSWERQNCDTFMLVIRASFVLTRGTQELWYFLCSCSKPLSCWLVNARIVILFMLVFKAFFVLTRERKNLWYFLCSFSKPLSCWLVNARIVILFMLVFKASFVLTRER